MNIKEVEVVDEYIKDSSTYGLSVSIKRSIPGTDGLKVVQRRIMYAMVRKLCYYNKPHIKSSAIVGNVIEDLHPHGDSSIYDAMVQLALWFKQSIPLVDPQGTFGTVQGHGPAAYRYTEARLSKFAELCIVNDLIRYPNIVTFVDNFDRKGKEPEIMPIAVPLAIINGHIGIGYGLKSSLPNHNFGEVITETIKCIEDPNYMPYLIPDNCQPTTIIGNKEDFDLINKLGEGSYKVRGNIDIVEAPVGKVREHHKVIITSLPDFVTLDQIISDIEKLISNNKLTGVVDYVDNTSITKSGRDKLCFILSVKSSENPYYIKDLLYKYTRIEDTVKVSFKLSVDNNRVEKFTYKSYIDLFIRNRVEDLFAKYTQMVSSLSTKIHRVEAYVKVLKGDINEVIKIVRKQDNSFEEQVELLIKKFNITNIQAEYILNTRITDLSKAKYNKSIKEMGEYEAEIKSLKKKLINKKLIVDDIKEELISFKEMFPTPRKSKVLTRTRTSNFSFNVILSKDGNIRKVDTNNNTPINMNNEKIVIRDVSDDDTIIVFDSHGKVFSLPMNKINVTNQQGPKVNSTIKNMVGEPITIQSLSKINGLSKIINKDGDKRIYDLVITKNGFVKHLDLNDIKHAPKTGVMYNKLNSNDDVVSVRLNDSNSDLILFTEDTILKLKSSDIKVLRKNSSGSELCTGGKEFVGSTSLVDKDKEYILIMGMYGKYNLLKIDNIEYGKLSKNGSLKKIIDEPIVNIVEVSMDSIVSIVSKKETVDINIKDLKVGTTLSKGYKLLNAKQNPINYIEVK